MAWGESKAWMRGSAHQKLYQSLLDMAMQAPREERQSARKILHPRTCPGRCRARTLGSTC